MHQKRSLLNYVLTQPVKTARALKNWLYELHMRLGLVKTDRNESAEEKNVAGDHEIDRIRSALLL